MKHLLQARSNSLFSNSLFIFLIRFFPTLANVLVVIIFSRALDKADYGFYQSFWTHLIVLSAIACMGAQSFSLTYTADAIRTLLRKVSPVFYRGLGIWVAMCSIAFAALHHNTFHIGWWVPGVYLLVYALSILAESLLIAFRQYKQLVLVNFLHTVAFCTFHWLLLKGMIGWHALFYFLLLAATIRLIIYGTSLYHNLKEKGNEVTFERPISDIRSLWLHLGAYDVIHVLFRWVDKAILEFIVVKELFAVYYNGTLDIPFLPLLLGAVAGAGLMKLAEHGDTNDRQVALTLLNRTGRLLSSVVFPVFFFFVFFRYELFTVVLSDKYLESVPIFLVSICAIPLKAYSFTTVLQNRHRGSIINKGAIFDLLLACILMYPLYLWLGLPGVAFSFVASSYLQAAYYLYHTGKLLNAGFTELIPIRNWLIKLIVFSCLFIAFHYFLSLYFQPVIVLFWGMVLAGGAALVSAWLEYRNTLHYGSSSQERDQEHR